MFKTTGRPSVIFNTKVDKDCHVEDDVQSVIFKTMGRVSLFIYSVYLVKLNKHKNIKAAQKNNCN